MRPTDLSITPQELAPALKLQTSDAIASMSHNLAVATYQVTAPGIETLQACPEFHSSVAFDCEYCTAQSRI